MNQILEYDTNRNSTGNGGSDKIVKIFAIFLVVFAIILICIVLKERSENTEVDNKENNQIKAEITVDIDEERSKATIHVSHEKVISKIMYSWGNSMEKNIKVADYATDVTEIIDVPKGNSVLHIKVIDENGIESEFSQETNVENGLDIKNPEINWEVTQDAKIKIVATDETELSFLTYRWNNEEEVRIDVGDDKTKIETEIEILKGENDLTIIAVDASNNPTTVTKSFTGRTKPAITVTLSADGSSVNIRTTDEYGIESIKLRFNDVDYDVEIAEGATYAEFPLNLIVGNNRIILTVTNIYGISASFDGECAYGQDTSEQDDQSGNETSEVENNISE